MSSIKEIIDRLGGNSEVARKAEVGPSTVSEWKRNGSVPVKYWPALLAQAEEIGTDLNEKDIMHAHLGGAAEAQANA